MGFSNLISETVLASSSNYTNGRSGNKICKITPHHMSGKLSGRRCAELFQNPSRQASANYCIGFDGEIVGCVDEDNRAWTSSSRSNDYQSITIEVSNCENGNQWKVSDASWNSLVKLCVDICRRYNFKLTYDETPNGSLTRHNMFANTDCPGPYLQSKFPELVQVVNAELDGETKPQQTSTRQLVKELQHVLNEQYNCGLSEDNIFGSLTSAACNKNYLYKGKNESTLHIKWLQTRLTELGYSVGNVE